MTVNDDLVWYGATALIGFLLGVLTLPWSDRGAKTPTALSWLGIWTFFWFYLLPFHTWRGLIAYRKAWWAYQDRRRVSKLKPTVDPLDDAMRMARENRRRALSTYTEKDPGE